jgi:hypothetical protein
MSNIAPREEAMIWRRRWSMTVSNTIGRSPSRAAMASMRATALWARSSVSDIGQAHEVEGDALELRQQRLAERLGRDAGAIGDEESGSFHGVVRVTRKADSAMLAARGVSGSCSGRQVFSMTRHLVWFDELGMHDVARVGGKNASLGEMISSLAHADVRVPDGFATTADAYREFLAQDGLDRRHRRAPGRTGRR